MGPHSRTTTLAAVVASIALAATGVPAGAAPPTTAYQMPFPCGETWSGGTRPGHSPSIDAISGRPSWRPRQAW
jgi:hypothetical protein